MITEQVIKKSLKRTYNNFRQLGENNISSIESVKIPESITKLFLEKNKIERLPPFIFKKLSKLTIL